MYTIKISKEQAKAFAFDIYDQLIKDIKEQEENTEDEKVEAA